MVKTKRGNCLARYTESAKSFDAKNRSNEIRKILNLNPSSAADCKEPAKKVKNLSTNTMWKCHSREMRNLKETKEAGSFFNFRNRFIWNNGYKK